MYKQQECVVNISAKSRGSCVVIFKSYFLYRKWDVFAMYLLCLCEAGLQMLIIVGKQIISPSGVKL